MTIIATAHLRGISPYSQSKFIDPALKGEKESHADFEDRCWRERMHVNADGKVFIPPMCFKKSLETSGRFLSMQIKGRGKATYTKHFKAGVLVTEALVLPVKGDDVPGETFFVPSDGKPGGGSRVKKHFPVVQEWEGDVQYYILDETISEDVFTRHLKEAGNFIGIGRFRPENGGFYGRYVVDSVNWANIEMDRAA